MSRALLRARTISISLSCCYTASPNTDHYAVLGLKQGASVKEIKTAYYKLSKVHHPDTNPDNKDEAAKKFHEVAQAYEVLGSDEGRRIYDMTRIRTTHDTGDASYVRRGSATRPTKQYTDVDIDYKSFEQFQRNTRRRKQYHSHFEMPDEFYAEFGGKSGVFKSEYDEATENLHGMHKDSRAVRREQEELEREMQREQARQQAKYPIPTFEQMMREKRKKEADEQKKYLTGLIGAASAGMLLYFIIR